MGMIFFPIYTTVHSKVYFADDLAADGIHIQQPEIRAAGGSKIYLPCELYVFTIV